MDKTTIDTKIWNRAYMNDVKSPDDSMPTYADFTAPEWMKVQFAKQAEAWHQKARKERPLFKAAWAQREVERKEQFEADVKAYLVAQGFNAEQATYILTSALKWSHIPHGGVHHYKVFKHIVCVVETHQGIAALAMSEEA